ncbi:MAG: 1-aminocyclopropane-1-carboxylate deaminase/D-cysteine desulfhydrase [Ignavibacteriales bacterium]|nr:MAG: 1-aminocyclopropane-1-carboxylate deaminase/D-cysteine desulfhydrase [Ignavibacteriales bacterium]
MNDFLNNIKLNQTPLQRIEDDIPDRFGVNLFIKRIDLIHPYISGNKWFKLKYNLIEALNKNIGTLLSFGGAYSNHIHALAAAGKELGFKTIGVIRGEEHLPLNPTLSFAKECGMLFHYLDRSSYRNKYSENIISELQKLYGEFYLIPEGGSNELAVKGCEEIMSDVEIPYNYVCCACGTAGTISGIISGSVPDTRILGISVLKGAEFLNRNVKSFLKNKLLNNWEINLDYHFGGYAKFNSSLINFIERFYEQHNIQLDPIYTGKLLFGIYDLISKNYFQKGSTIIAIHSGGLQGLAGMQSKIRWLKQFA